MRAGLNGNAGQGLLGRGGEGLGEYVGSCVRADLGIASGSGHALCEALAGVCRQSNLGSINLISLGLAAADSRTGGGIALIPLHRAGIGRRATHINRGVQRHTLDRGINRGGHAGDRCLGDGDAGSSDAPGRKRFNFSLIAICKCVLDNFKVAISRLTVNYREGDSQEGLFCITLSRGTIIPRSRDCFSGRGGFHIFCCPFKHAGTNDVFFSNR